jgi:hypothetical protein
MSEIATSPFRGMAPRNDIKMKAIKTETHDFSNLVNSNFDIV